mgnify:CR=1 FL=1
MKSPIFARVRKEAVAVILVAAGSSVLAACSSDKANYRPAPNYTKPTTAQGAPAYTPPSYTAPAPAPQYAPAPAPAQKPGGFACGKGKCG